MVSIDTNDRKYRLLNLTAKHLFTSYFCATMSYILIAILCYLLFRFIVGFVLPVARTTSQVRKQFHSMKEQMDAHQNADQQQHSSNKTNVNAFPDQRPNYDIEGEYIPFEETKEK
jgi:hypothetical protein